MTRVKNAFYSLNQSVLWSNFICSLNNYRHRQKYRKEAHIHQKDFMLWNSDVYTYLKLQTNLKNKLVQTRVCVRNMHTTFTFKYKSFWYLSLNILMCHQTRINNGKFSLDSGRCIHLHLVSFSHQMLIVISHSW